MSVTLYSQPQCFKCDATKRYLDKENIDYQVIDVTQDPSAMQHIKKLGYLMTPVVQVGDKVHWSDFRIELIKKIPSFLRGEPMAMPPTTVVA
jgi:glutaredoxin-like protein NrdH